MVDGDVKGTVTALVSTAREAGDAADEACMREDNLSHVWYSSQDNRDSADAATRAIGGAAFVAAGPIDSEAAGADVDRAAAGVI